MNKWSLVASIMSKRPLVVSASTMLSINFVKIVRFALSIAATIATLLSPPYCINCERLLPEHTVLCSDCLTQLPKISYEKNFVTASCPLIVHAYTAYQKPFEKLIQAKLRSQQSAIQQLAYLLADYAEKQSFTPDCIVPIPLYWQRKMWRGFNQSEILAQAVARRLDKPLSCILKRVKNTAFQSTLTAPERKLNLENAFMCTMPVKNKRILLIDDLYTTGATAHAAACQLYKQGAASVELLVVCKVTD